MTYNPETPGVAAHRTSTTGKVLFCLLQLWRSMGIRRYIRDWNKTKKKEKKALLQHLADVRAKIVFANSTRSQTTLQEHKAESSLNPEAIEKVSLKVEIEISNPFFTLTVKMAVSNCLRMDMRAAKTTNRWYLQNTQLNVSPAEEAK